MNKLEIHRCFFIRGKKVIETDEGKFFMVPKGNREKVFRYLETKKFPFFLPILSVYRGTYEVYRYMNDDIDIRKYGSQGQQRTAALSLKLSEIYLVKKKIKDTPVLLLDDVLSELDSNRQTYLLESIHDIQTLITCTGLDDFVSHQFEINKVFQVVKGHVYMPKGF